MIFFNLRKPNLLIHLRPIIKSLKNSDVSIGLILDDKDRACFLDEELTRFPMFEESKVASLPTKGITVSADVHSKAPPNTLHLNTFHNQPVKYWMHPKPLLSKIDGFLCWGSFQKKYIKHLYASVGLMDPLIFESGAPLLDRMFDGINDKEKIRQKHKIDLEKKTILIAPSWNEGLLLREHGNELFEVLLNAPKNINLLLRLHPASMFSSDGENNNYFNGGQNWREKISTLLRARSNIFDFSSEPDAVEALIMSDCVITDVSSIAWDALTINSDVFFVDCPNWPDVAHKNRNFGNPTPTLTLNHDFLNAGKIYGNGVLKFDQLNALLMAYENKELLPPRQASFIRLRQRLLYNPGSATRETKRILKKLYKDIYDAN